MIRQTLHTDTAPGAIGPYSQGIKASGELYFFSGQIPLTPAGEMMNGSIEDQITQVLENLQNLLSANGLTPANVVKTTIFLSSMDHFGVVNEHYGKLFPTDPPARSTVAVAGLPRNVDVEIEMIAVK